MRKAEHTTRRGTLLSLSFVFALLTLLLGRELRAAPAPKDVTLSPPSVDLGYQLVGTTGPQVTEKVTNSGTAPLVITNISVSGGKQRDFLPSYSFTLPATVAPGNSVVISLAFDPSLPWTPGTRRARLVISEKNHSQEVPLTGIGATCGGPVPACTSGCADTDGDGLNDAWEIAGGIDLDNDGKIDAQHDLLLPGADPNKPDVYLKYDYMVATTTSAIGTPPHSHQPPAAAIQQVVDSFAAHGVALHIDPQHDAIPEVLVTTLDPDPTIACAGTDFVTIQTLRNNHLGNRKWAYHYGIFAHNAVLPDTAPNGNACPIDPECLGHPDPTASGSSEVPGDSFIVALGNDVDNGFRIGVETWAGTFMHELGHNFGLKHGSLAAPTTLQSCLTNKPNYVSVMDYSYQSGIGVAAATGSASQLSCNADSDCPPGDHCTDDLGGGGGGNVCYRVDYSREKLLDLNEASLDETVGVGGPAGDTDIVIYCARGAGCSLSGPSDGPIDWDNDGDATETNAQGDIDNDNDTPNTTLQTGNDWEVANGVNKNLNFKFQCTSAFASGGGEGAAPGQVQSSIVTTELGLKQAQEGHILHPPAAVSLILSPGCSNPRMKPRTPGAAQLALMGSSSFDVSQVDPASLTLHGAHPTNISAEDVNGDGLPDLLLEFPTADVQLSARATHARLTGWLENSRSFVGEAQLSTTCPN
jgi:hypothetical protein